MALPKPALTSTMQQLGYRFNDTSLLEQALTHRSAADQHNERLEFLGDAVLGLIIAEVLFEKFPRLAEGELSRMRATLVCGRSLAKVAQRFQLGAAIHLGQGELKSGGQRRESILADALEACLGAIYLDSDLGTCRQVVRQWFAVELAAIEPGANHKDPKTQLQEYLQGKALALPEYHIEVIQGQAHNQSFTVSCQVSVLDHPVRGQGSSRRKAEQQAARLVLQQLLSKESPRD